VLLIVVRSPATWIGAHHETPRLCRRRNLDRGLWG
jgi:hypothetical protein